MEKKKILVVDNDPLMLTMISSFLDQDGHDVVCVADSFSALDALRDFTPQIIFLDLVMPKIAGDALCKIFRTIPLLRDCYIVILSAAVLEQPDEFLEMGADAYIAKGPLGVMKHHVLQTVEESAIPRHPTPDPKVRGAGKIRPLQITSELLGQNKQLQLILESMSQGVLAISDNRVFYANTAALSIFRIARERLLGASLNEILAPVLWNNISPLLQFGAVGSANALPDAHMQIHDRSVIVQCLSAQNNGTDQILMLTDITELKKTKNKLHRAEELWKTTFDAIVDPIAILTADGEIRQCNRAFSDFLKTNSLSSEKNAYLRLIEQIDVVSHPRNVSSDDGRTERELLTDGKTYRVTVDTLKSPGNRDDLFIHILHDITKRKQAVKALQESEERYRSLFDRSMDGVYLVDFEGRFLDANQAVLDLLGYRREDIRLHTFASLLSPDQLPLALESINDLKATGFQKNRKEYRVLRQDGGTVHLETQASLLCRDGEPFAIQGIARDITERKIKEQEKQELIQKLQNAVEEIKTLKGIVPICSNCKKIRDDKGFWENVEAYMAKHTDVQFSHGICPDCLQKLYPGYLRKT